MLATFTLTWGGMHVGAAVPTLINNQAVDVDCRALIGTDGYERFGLLMSHTEQSAERFRLKSPDERQQCLSLLVQGVTRPGTGDEYEACFLETLARRGLIEDAALIDPLIECVSNNLNEAGSYCNRALAALTRQSYGLTFFAHEAPATPYTVENRDRIVSDWKAYDRLREHGHPIFDALLADASASAIRVMRARLVDTLTSSVPNHVILSYLGSPDPTTIPRQQGQARVIYSFGLGDLGLGPGFALPGNWLSGRSRLLGIRILMFRPGVAHAASDVRAEQEIEQFPVEDADYHEVFRAFDLEVRFQIVTSSDNLRRMTIGAVNEALTGLREANAAAVR